MAESQHVGNMPLQDLSDQMRKIAKTFADDKDDILKSMIFHAIANRLDAAVKEIRELKSTLAHPYLISQLHLYLDEAHGKIDELKATLAVRDEEARERLKKIEQMERERLVDLGPGGKVG